MEFNANLIIDKKDWMGIRLRFKREDFNTILIIIKTVGFDKYDQIGKELNKVKSKWIEGIKHGINDDLVIYDPFNKFDKECYILHPSYIEIEPDSPSFIEDDELPDGTNYLISTYERDIDRNGFYEYDELFIHTILSYSKSLVRSITISFKETYKNILKEKGEK